MLDLFLIKGGKILKATCILIYKLAYVLVFRYIFLRAFELPMFNFSFFFHNYVFYKIVMSELINARVVIKAELGTGRQHGV